jgi:hypothetical protein
MATSDAPELSAQSSSPPSEVAAAAGRLPLSAYDRIAGILIEAAERLDGQR